MDMPPRLRFAMEKMSTGQLVDHGVRIRAFDEIKYDLTPEQAQAYLQACARWRYVFQNPPIDTLDEAWLYELNQLLECTREPEYIMWLLEGDTRA